MEIIASAAKTRASTLDLSNQRLTALPPEIGSLVHLKALNLSFNELNALPLEISHLVSLNALNLSGNQLERLPLGITMIPNLYELDLSYNDLKDLPSEIGRLFALSMLNLSFTQIRTLPTDFSCLKNLRVLDISYTQIRSLPIVVTQLVHLTALDLSVNRLEKLPPEIGHLYNLRTLDLHDNQLSSLPLEIGELEWLITLDLTGNPLPTLPPEIREAGCASVINFYRQQLEQDTDRLYEAKLLIIGEGGAGKTTLLNKICNPNYKLKASESSTKGIDIVEWSFPVNDGKEFKVNIWDFGGQEIYHATHQFFLTKRSLYALVADSRKEDTDFYYWLNVVELLSDSSPLLIVSNEKQDRKRDINERQLRGEFTNLKEILPVNLATNRGLLEILSTVKNHICSLSHIGTELPKTWIKVREALERDTRNYINLEEYLALCELHGFINLKDKLQLSEYLHDLGICLHFQQDDLLFKTIVLKPTWGTDAVYKVLDNPVVIRNRGKFNRSDLDEIWHENKYTTMRAELLRLMMNFKLCYEIPSCPGVYIAPELLDSSQPSYPWDDNDNLLLRYEYEFMPKGILTRFIVEMHSAIEHQTCVWKSGVVLNNGNSRAEITEYYRYHKGEVRIRVAGKRKRDLLTTIRHELGIIHRSYERLRYKTFVPCNCSTCKSSQNTHFYLLETLYRFSDDNQEHIQCQSSYQMVPVRGLIDDIEPIRGRAERQGGVGHRRPPKDTVVPSATMVSVNIQNNPEIRMSEVNQNHYGKGDNIARDKITNKFNTSPSLAEAARDIKELLDQISSDYPNNTFAGQAMIGAKAIEQIEKNPTLRQRVVNALREAGATALEEAIDHPAIRIVVAGTKGFVDI